jgi:hypothetical protein
MRLTAVLVMVLAGTTPAPRAQSATGEVAGVVVSADTPPQPVRRAIVTIAGGGLAQPASAVTDTDGRFRFLQLRPGRYSLSARKPAHLTTVYGATSPGGSGTPIHLSAGSAFQARIVLPRGAAITGVVRDSAGAPIREVPVVVAPVSTVSTQRVLATQPLRTDDRGVYRAFGLPPGEYLVVVSPRVFIGSGEIYGFSRAEVDARLLALEQRHGAATASAAAQATAMSARSSPVSLAPIYHPGTPQVANASRVRVAVGEERSGIDVVLAPVRTARVSGVIVTPDIAVTRIRPTLLPLAPPLPSMTGPALMGPDADGRFSFEGVTPGRYTLAARTGQGALMSYADGRGASTTNPDIPSRFASIDIDVDGQDVGGLTLVLQPMPSLSGRLVFSGTAKPPTGLTGARIQLRADGPLLAGAAAPFFFNNAPTNQTFSGAVSSDGAFVIAGLMPAAYSINAILPAESALAWKLSSAVLNGRELLDLPLQVALGAADMSGAVLTFTDQRSELAGTLTVPADQTADRYTIVVFTEDKSLWRPGARRLRTVRPVAGGTFSIMDLPAGDYLLAAVDNTPPEDWQQASFLEQLAAASVKVTIRDRAKTLQDIKIAK